jgi:hypothetical protein
VLLIDEFVPLACSAGIARNPLEDFGHRAREPRDDLTAVERIVVELFLELRRRFAIAATRAGSAMGDSRERPR